MKTLSIDQMIINEGCAGEEINWGTVFGCAGLMWLAGKPWSIGISMVGTPIAGYIFDFGWTAFSTWVCAHA